MNPLAPYLFWIKVGFAALVVMAVVWVGLIVRGWHQDSLALEGVRQEMADLKASQAASHAASKGLQNEIEKLRGDRKPSPDIRLRRCPDKVPPTGTGRNGPAAASGGVSPEDGQDSRNVGPDLYALADEADELAARLRACQALLK